MLHSWNGALLIPHPSNNPLNLTLSLSLRYSVLWLIKGVVQPSRHANTTKCFRNENEDVGRCDSHVYESLTFSSPFLSSFLAPISWFRPQSDIFWVGLKHKKDVTSSQRMVFTLTDLVQDAETWNNVSFPHIFARPCHPKSDSLWHLPRLTLATIICLRRHRPILLIPSFLLFKAKEATHTLELWMGKNCTRSHSKVTREASILFSNLDDSKPSK